MRLEIATTLKRNIQVIGVMVHGTRMYLLSNLPDELKLLVRCNALEVCHNRFNAYFGRFAATFGKVLGKADTDRKEHEEKERQGAEQPQKAEQQEKQCVDAVAHQRKEEERRKAEQREKERLEAEQSEIHRLAPQQRGGNVKNSGVQTEPEKAQTAGSSSGFPVGEKACFYALDVIAFITTLPGG